MGPAYGWHWFRRLRLGEEESRSDDASRGDDEAPETLPSRGEQRDAGN
jgi:hypothetical protein